MLLFNNFRSWLRIRFKDPAVWRSLSQGKHCKGREALYCLDNYNKDIKPKNLIRTEHNGSKIVPECKEQYIKEMFSYTGTKRLLRRWIKPK